MLVNLLTLTLSYRLNCKCFDGIKGNHSQNHFNEKLGLYTCTNSQNDKIHNY